MSHSTTETFKMKREILNYSGKISAPLRKPERKFFADMLYGVLASGSCLLSEITQELHESTKKINVVDRLSRHLAKGIPQKAEIEYLRFIRRSVPANPVVYIDDSDVVKAEGYHFEALGVVRDGSASSKDKAVYEKGYHVTEACVMTNNHQPISLFSKIHSSNEKSFILITVKTAYNPASGSNAVDEVVRKLADSIAKAVNNTFKSEKHFIPEAHFPEFFPYLFDWVHLRSIGMDGKELNIIRNSSILDLCQAAPSQQSRTMSFLYFFDSSRRNTFIQSVLQYGITRKKWSPLSGSTAP